MPGFSFVTTLFGTASQSVETLTDLDIGWSESGPVLYATSRIGQDITIFDLGTGPARLIDQQSLPTSVSPLGPLQLELIDMNGTVQAVSLTGATAGLPSYEIGAQGTLNGGTEYLSANGLSQSVTAMTSARIDGQQYLWVVAEDQAGMSCFKITENDRLQRHPDGAAGGLPDSPDGISALIGLSVGAQTYLFAASTSEDRVFSYQMNTNGTLEQASSLGAAEGLGLNAPTALEQVTLNGQTFLLVAASGSSSISVLQISPDGGMTATDHVVDDRTSRFQNVTSIETVEVDGRVYVLAGGADDGMSLFTLLPDGRLLHLDAVADQVGFSLQNVSTVTAAAHDGQLQIFAGSATEAGLTQFTVDLGDIGDHVQASANGGNLFGTSGNDILQDGIGNDNLRGDAGDDILMAGQGADRLYGGAGRDIFVLSADGIGDQIRDFESGLDRIDLSGWPMLRGLEQLQISSLNNGGSIRFGAENLRLYSADGQAMTPFEIQAAVLDNFLHFSVEFLTAPMILTGTNGNDILRGRSGDDVLQGKAGADQLIGGDGIDTASYADDVHGLRIDLRDPVRNNGIAAGDTYDSIENLIGGRDRDRLYGTDGANQIDGGRDIDFLSGRAGDDTLIGGNGNDTLVGGNGADLLIGGAHRDSASYINSKTGVLADLLFSENNTGEASGDIYRVIEDLVGGNHNDILYGDGRDNRLTGHGGSDRLYGRGGDDYLIGGAQHDVLHGGPGDDLLRGQGHGDTFIFTKGHDRILDFKQEQGDMIALRAASLWSGTLSVQEVIETYARIENGVVMFDFGENSLTLDHITTLDGLANDLILL